MIDRLVRTRRWAVRSLVTGTTMVAGVGAVGVGGAAAQSVTRPLSPPAPASESGGFPVMLLLALAILVGAFAVAAVMVTKARAADDGLAGSPAGGTLRPTAGRNRATPPPPAPPRPAAASRPVPPPKAAPRAPAARPAAAVPSAGRQVAPAPAPVAAAPAPTAPLAPTASPAPAAKAAPRRDEVDGAGTAAVSTSGGNDGTTTRNGYKKRVRGAHVPRTDVLAARGNARGDETDAAPTDEAPASNAEAMRNLLSGFQAGSDRARAETEGEGPDKG